MTMRLSLLNKLWLACLLALSLPPTPCYADGDQHSGLRFQRMQGGAISTLSAINVVVQDSQGFIWMGGENGLGRYDGNQVKVYRVEKEDPNSISSGYIWDAVIDNEGYLWVATGRGLNQYDPIHDNFKHYFKDAQNNLASSNIRSLAVGADNTLYIGTGGGFSVLSPDRQSFKHFFHDAADPNSLSHNYIREIFIDSKQRVWLGTLQGGLNLFHPDSGQFSHYRATDETGALSLDNIKAISQLDDENELWVGTYGGGISILNISSGQFRYYRHDPNNHHSLGGDTIWSLFKDDKGNMWVGADHGGLSRFRPELGDFDQYVHHPYQGTTLATNSIRRVYQDQQGDLWISHFPGGISFLNGGSNKIQNFRHRPDNPNSLSNSAVLTFLQDRSGDVWVGTERGLNLFHPASQRFQHFFANEDDASSLQASTILSLAEDSQGDIWVGTWSGGLHRFNKKSQSFTHFLPDKNKPDSINGEYIWSIEVAQDNRLWIGTETGGVNLYNPETGKFKHYLPSSDANSLSFAFVWTIHQDAKGRIWIATQNGLNLYREDSDDFQRFFHDPDNDNSISSNLLTALLSDSSGRIWIGSQDAGLSIYDPEQKSFTRLGVDDGLPSTGVSSFVEDEQGYIWAATVNGIVKIDPLTLNMRTYNQSSGLASNNHNRNASMIDQYGNLYVGGTEGFSVFHPEQLETVSTPPNVVFTDLQIFNKSIKPGGEGSPLKRNINYSKTLELKHEHSVLTFYFAALSYRASENNQYAYMLEGFDQNWIQAGPRTSATYTNIDPGRYTLRVKAANSDGVWNHKGTELKIHVTPPLWRSQGAYALYILMTIAFIVVFVKMQSRRIAFEKEKRVNEKLRKLDQMKDAFLANTSHELRTPLNGIIGLAEALASGAFGPLSTDVIYKLNMISSSGKRLSNLINDILDFSKLNQNKLSLKLRPIDLYQISDSVINLLAPLIGTKELNLINDIAPCKNFVLADENRLQQILFNLIGNAIKYTDKGSITLSCECLPPFIWVKVKDSGIGIPEQELASIFTAFSQVETNDDKDYGGTGLGLAISKHLVQLHGGSLNVRSQVNRGSEFSFSLQLASAPATLSNSSFDISDEQSTAAKQNELVAVSAPQYLQAPDATQEDKSQDKIPAIIIDDDPVNRLVLSSMLSLRGFEVSEASSGFEALDLFKNGPRFRLAIMDVMMPRLSGYETCRRLRRLYSVNELCLIFLSAKNAKDDLIRGLLAGGNDFLVKPVEKQHLLNSLDQHMKRVSCDQQSPSESLFCLQQQLIDIAHGELAKESIFKQTLECLQKFAIRSFGEQVQDGLILGISYWQFSNNTLQFMLATDDLQQDLAKQHKSFSAHIYEPPGYDAASFKYKTLSKQEFKLISPLAFEFESTARFLLVYFEHQALGVFVFNTQQDLAKQLDAILAPIECHLTMCILKAQ